ncbi:DUF2861 family protein [Photobacterium sagamiensis]|uniref:DUF2861 family protein n=1 Tax=Photobacterium sagamiensis TaxID=2910241 RepID=UPI003D09DCA8
MTKLSFTCTLLLLHSALFASGASATWFTGKDLYTAAHQRLLKGETSASFESMIQAWQQTPNAEQRINLNNLLELAISEDCGHSLEQKVLPPWLSKLSIQREVIQNLNQVTLKVSIIGLTQAKIESIKLTKWPDETMIERSPVIEEGGDFSVEARRLEKPINAGLYKLTINAEGEQAWISWILLTEPSFKQRIGWKDSKNWRIERGQLSNPACPSPVLSINLYDLNDTTWTPLWTEQVDGKLPTTLPKIDVPDGRYWLSVGLIDSRWQGEISILDIQRITRPVDHPDF